MSYPEEYLEHCKTLGLKPGFTRQQLQTAYRDLANVWHPDRHINNPNLHKTAEQKMQDINLAFEWLVKNPQDDVTSNWAESWKERSQWWPPPPPKSVEPEKPKPTGFALKFQELSYRIDSMGMMGQILIVFGVLGIILLGYLLHTLWVYRTPS